MSKKIFKAICAVALSVFAATLIIIMSALYNYFSNVQKKQLLAQTALASQGVAASGMNYFNGLEIENQRITWIAADGTVLYDNMADSAGMENHLERKEVKEALQSGSGQSSRYSVTLMERLLYAAKRLPDGTVIRMSVRQNAFLTLLLGFLQPISIIVLLALVLSFILASRLSKKIVEPLNRLNLDAPLKSAQYEEISPLLKRIDAQQAQLRRDKEALEKTEQIRREFTSNVSHELKTPLHVISGYAELLRDGLVKESDICDFAGKIHSESSRMTRLVEDIIYLSRLDDGGQDMPREQCDLYTVAQNAADSLNEVAREKNISITLSGESAVISGIPQALYSIVYNLCDNAIKYNREGGSIEITVSNIGDDAVLSVRDNGIGISPEHQDRIFERFYRVDSSHSKKVGGTGLGLSIVKHAAKIHGARLCLKSEISKGTEITVSFPKK